MTFSGIKKNVKVQVILLTILVMPSFTYGFGSWNQETTARELCFLYTLSNDWQQTLDIAKNPIKYKEENRILGSHPDVNNVNLYFASCAVSHALITYVLPPKLSKLWQVTWIGIQSNVTHNNNENGLDQNMNLEFMIKFTIRF